MLSALELENFRSFGTRTRIPMAPITLVLGENSAGKSSILHALTVLKQSLDSRSGDAPLLPRATDGIADFGTFTDLLYDHDSRRTLHIGLEAIGPFDNFGPTRPLIRQLRLDRILVDLAFAKEAHDSETRFSSFGLYAGHERELLARFETSPSSDPQEHSFPFHLEPSLFSRLVAPYRFRRSPSVFSSPARCTAVTEWKQLWEVIHRSWSERRSEIAELLDHPPDWSRLHQFRSQDESPLSSLEDTRAFYSADFTPDQLRQRLTQWCSATQVWCTGFIPHSSGLSALHLLPELSPADALIQMGRLPLLDLGWFTDTASTALEDTILRLFPLGPWRRPPERHYIFSGTSPRDVGYSGAQFPVLLYRTPKLLDRANEWMNRLQVGHELTITPLGHDDSGLFELRLVDKRRARDVDVALTDVGFGVSQILPFVVQCLVASGRLISIEQPEVHVHPRLQAELGELIASCISEPYNHQFLVETHSEHLVLRFQKLVRNKLIRPQDVSVVFVSRTKHGSAVKHLQLDDDGDFMDEWPGGFFPERLRELR